VNFSGGRGLLIIYFSGSLEQLIVVSVVCIEVSHICHLICLLLFLLLAQICYLMDIRFYE